MSRIVEEDDDTAEMQALFKTSNPLYDLSNVKEDEAFNRILMSADPSRRMASAKPGSAMRLGTSTGFQRQSTALVGTAFRPGTQFRPPTGSEGVNRPMTAVRGAGYTSQKQMFDPFNQAAMTPAPALEIQKDDSPEEKIRVQELKIMQLVEESCLASSEGNNRKALSKAKEASNKERSLIRMQEQSGLGDHHNMDLTYSVLFTLANQYAANDLFTEALNTYQLITKNRMFSNAHRLKVNMGNIFYSQGQFHKAIKMYRMALDQVPSSQKNLRIKIMHNIAMVFVKMGQYEEAITSLEYIMSEQPNHRAGLHLVICCRAMEDKDRMRSSFSILLAVPLELEDEEKYSSDQDNQEDILIASAIRNDDLHVYEMKKRSDAEHCILTAAKLIAPLIEDTFSDGYDWCVETIKSSEYARLAGELEINKAVMFLKQGQLNEAIETLKAFDKESTIATSAATNLSFIYYLQGDFDNAEKYGEIVKNSDGYNAGGFVNLGACAFGKGNYDQARNYFVSALDCDPSSVEALYNLGLVLKYQGNNDEALECFQKFTGSLALLPEVVFQIAVLLERSGDTEASAEAYQQLLGLVPTDATVLQKIGELYDHDGDKQQAHHYHIDSFRYYPAELSVIDWLGSYYIEMQIVEKALKYFEKAAVMQPSNPKWQMMVAGCHRRSGNLHKALTLYQAINRQFPESVECLRFLVRLCSDLGLREAQDYALELKKLEKSKEVRERVGSSRPGSRRSNSGLSSRAGSGFSPVPENGNYVSPLGSGSRRLRTSRLTQMHNSAGSGDSGFAQPTLDTTYVDPLGPLPSRPRTQAGKPLDFDDFADDQIGDDLLPE
ncbi:PREDICTED: intraflagellar transport protein 88 homolog [Nicrophorus vespilloides]|uniref:Intraflagellar transport protein 88 homolog n=1 Tax=Nicrophorus vespilloides TaxID=110193 RepID=A0ABM1NHG1_NICVS|nr:PREDICTED: intraflagellar transport protein 88 homolog [Nicrophorus vespilloides]